MFDFSAQNPDFSNHYITTTLNIRHLDQNVVEKKENVLNILLQIEDDVLDDKR
jgi:hypothetical protein